MSVAYPCKDCQKREVGCHSKCKGYLQKREEQDAINAYIRNDIEMMKEFCKSYMRYEKFKRRIHR